MLCNRFILNIHVHEGNGYYYVMDSYKIFTYTRVMHVYMYVALSLDAEKTSMDFVNSSYTDFMFNTIQHNVESLKLSRPTLRHETKCITI